MTDSSVSAPPSPLLGLLPPVARRIPTEVEIHGGEFGLLRFARHATIARPTTRQSAKTSRARRAENRANSDGLSGVGVSANGVIVSPRRAGTAKKLR
jgi:hypothetical protein